MGEGGRDSMCGLLAGTCIKKQRKLKGGGEGFDLIYIGIKNGSGLTWRCFGIKKSHGTFSTMGVFITLSCMFLKLEIKKNLR